MIGCRAPQLSLKIATVLVGVLLAGGIGQARKMDWSEFTAPVLLDLKSSNCGYNCAAFAISHFRLPISSGQVCAKLNLDPQLTNATSLSTLQRALSSFGLETEAVGGVSSESFFDIDRCVSISVYGIENAVERSV
jgi:hypothetical protein